MLTNYLILFAQYSGQAALLAYADPGSGMLIWQLATAAVLGLLFYAKTAIRKIRRLKSNSQPKDPKITSADAETIKTTE